MPSGIKMPWRRDAVKAPGSDLTAVTTLDLINVTLQTEVGGQPAEVTGLGLGFDSVGMTVRKEDGSTFVKIPWGAITGVSADVLGTQNHSLATAVALEIQSELKTHKFLVPNVQPKALTGSLTAISAKYGPPVGQGHGRSRKH
jgi:hypothetical protein